MQHQAGPNKDYPAQGKGLILSLYPVLLPSPVTYPHSDYNSLDGNTLADKIPLAQHLPGDILTKG